MAVDSRLVDDAVTALRRSGVSAGQLWRGPRGSVYRIAVIGVALPSCEPMIGCDGPDGVARLYHLAMFMGRAKQGNVLVPRFTLCEEYTDDET
jgi:hypothetical protein